MFRVIPFTKLQNTETAVKQWKMRCRTTFFQALMQKQTSVLILHLIFHCVTDVYVPFCGLIKGITSKICMLCFVLINSVLLIIIIMYIYCALINALSTHIIHTNLDTIFYTHVEHSPIKNNLHKVLYGNTHTHTHRNEFECAWHTSYMHTHTHYTCSSSER